MQQSGDVYLHRSELESMAATLMNGVNDLQNQLTDVENAQVAGIVSDNELVAGHMVRIRQLLSLAGFGLSLAADEIRMANLSLNYNKRVKLTSDDLHLQALSLAVISAFPIGCIFAEQMAVAGPRAGAVANEITVSATG